MNNENNNLNNDINNIGIDNFFDPNINNNSIDNNQSVNNVVPNNNIGINNTDNAQYVNDSVNTVLSNNDDSINNANIVTPSITNGVNSMDVTSQTEFINPSDNMFDNVNHSINSVNEPIQTNTPNSMVYNSIDTSMSNMMSSNFDNNNNVNNEIINMSSNIPDTNSNLNSNMNNAMPNGMNNSTFVNNSFVPNNNIDGVNSNNIQPQVNTINTINPNMSMKSQPLNNTAKKKSNRVLIIVLIIVIVLAIASAVFAYLFIINKDSKTENDYESTNGTNNTTNTTVTTTSTDNSNTIEQDGFVFNKKTGYEYDNDYGILYIYGSNSAFQVSILPYKFETIFAKSTEIEETMTNYGYAFNNKKTTAYDGKNVLSYEVAYEDNNVLYVVYAAPDANYSIQLVAVSRDNTFNYNLITESFNLTNDIKKTGTTTYAKTDDNIIFSSIGDNLFIDMNGE